MERPRISVVGLGKSYGPLAALTNVNLKVGAGTVLGVLGHNGAGKTTLIDILATRTLPTSGSASVCGWDVVRYGDKVRRCIGMSSQFTSVDETMSGRANLILVARLLGATAKQAAARADELLAVFGLTEAAKRKPATYSGGMRRRLDLAAGMLGRPEVLFLDEPSTGLDPVSRSELWTFIERLAREGTSVVLTTQYLEEADRLADELVVLAGGHVVAKGTPAALKAKVGSRSAKVTFVDVPTTRNAAGALAYAGIHAQPEEAFCAIVVPVAAGHHITGLVRALDKWGIAPTDLTVTEPTLDDVYLALHRAARSQS
ncbi:MAG TPA: ATP-binding cassette domain-containing protein [Actinokineospora sp.]|nr:ATP-binding cassette domain-containing protein [Actinokineospora sp.]